MGIPKNGFEFWKNLMPEDKDMISLKVICDKANASRMPMTKRRIIYYVNHGVLERWVRLGREAYYKEKYIVPALTCISILRVQFGFTLGKIKKIMIANSGSVDALLDRLEFFIKEYMDKKPAYYHTLETQFLQALTVPNSPVDFKALEKEAQKAHEKYINGK
jgi:DNA-binding transcriptional MerR regulator